MISIDELIASPRLILTKETDIFDKALDLDDPVHKALIDIGARSIEQYEEVLAVMLQSIKGVIAKQLVNYLRKLLNHGR